MSTGLHNLRHLGLSYFYFLVVIFSMRNETSSYGDREFRAARLDLLWGVINVCFMAICHSIETHAAPLAATADGAQGAAPPQTQQ